MEEYKMVIVAMGAAMVIVSSFFCVYQLYGIVKTDAECRGLKHPKLWGFSVSYIDASSISRSCPVCVS